LVNQTKHRPSSIGLRGGIVPTQNRGLLFGHAVGTAVWDQHQDGSSPHEFRCGKSPGVPVWRRNGLKIGEALNRYRSHHNNMNSIFTHCLTLRLEPKLDELLTEAAFDRRLTKSDWIRIAIRQGLKHQQTTTTVGVRTCR
jgi:Ribbon-helix-helix protein, copG family